MLGPGKIDSLGNNTIGLSLFDVSGNLRQAGGLRTLAETFARRDPMIACVHGIDAGDALALATRFEREWAYRGREALFWRGVIRAQAVHDRYLPLDPGRPFERRGLLQVEATHEGLSLALVATTFGDDRAARIRDLRFARSVLRSIEGAAVAFLGNGAKAEAGLRDLGFTEVARDTYNLIVVRPSQATPPPHTAGSQDASASIERI
jgi:hypothetical protein